MTRKRIRKLAGYCALLAVALHGAAALGFGDDASLDFFHFSCVPAVLPGATSVVPDLVATPLVAEGSPPPQSVADLSRRSPRGPPA